MLKLTFSQHLTMNGKYSELSMYRRDVEEEG